MADSTPYFVPNQFQESIFLLWARIGTGFPLPEGRGRGEEWIGEEGGGWHAAAPCVPACYTDKRLKNLMTPSH